MKTVNGGFGKWSIGINKKTGGVIVGFGHYPNFGKIELYDMSVEDACNLADMFASYASKLNAAIKKEMK